MKDFNKGSKLINESSVVSPVMTESVGCTKSVKCTASVKCTESVNVQNQSMNRISQ